GGRAMICVRCAASSEGRITWVRWLPSSSPSTVDCPGVDGAVGSSPVSRAGVPTPSRGGSCQPASPTPCAGALPLPASPTPEAAVGASLPGSPVVPDASVPPVVSVTGDPPEPEVPVSGAVPTPLVPPAGGSVDVSAGGPPDGEAGVGRAVVGAPGGSHQ